VGREAKHSSESNEWYTPERYIEAAREVLAEIDLDPASCEQANEVVQATMYFTNEMDGLSPPWHGRVFLNPPYGRTAGRSNQEAWSQRLIDQHTKGNVTSAILLVNAEPGTKWFQPLWGYGMCFTDHRIRFYTKGGERNAPTHSNCFVYLPPRNDLGAYTRFPDVFERFGAVIDPLCVRRKEVRNAEAVQLSLVS
jgi:DNA N-6-adenine-methyltransferase (Dam)